MAEYKPYNKVVTITVPAGGSASGTIQLNGVQAKTISATNAGADVTASLSVEGISFTSIDFESVFGKVCVVEEIDYNASNSGASDETFDIVIWGVTTWRK